MFLILTLIIIVAAFNIISGLTILIKNKTREIAILKSLGLDKKSIIKSFFLTGFLIGFAATITGLIFGILFSINIESIRVFLKYDYNGNPVIENIKRVSRPGLRVYVGAGEAPRVLDGLGVSILSTSKGVLSNKKANQLGVGGELICEVY